MTSVFDRDDIQFQVVVNHEEQYSIWPEYKEIPQGWRAAGKSGLKKDCLAYIEEVWTDMRPLSLRQHALLLERRSPWAPAACELAARYALACAERCDGDEPLERECAGACRRFVEACRPLLPA